MDLALAVHRLQFAFTVTFHYIFPQLTMGLALLIVVLKTMALRTGNERYNECGALLGKNFRHQFRDGRRHRHSHGVSVRNQLGALFANAGGVIGQTLAMEGVFSFFLESTFLGLFLFGEKKLGPACHWFSAFLVFLGSWLSGYFIIATDAWMQHPDGLPAGAPRRHQLDQLLGPAAQSLDSLAVPPQHDRRGGDGQFRDGRARRVLSAGIAHRGTRRRSS